VSRYRFELASAADDADLRRVLAETPMPGPITVTFQREPSYFDAAVVEGDFRQVLACRDGNNGPIVGFGARAIDERYVNGRPEPVGYLSGLRLLEAHRNLGLVARGYAYLRRLHEDGRTRLYVTTIAAGNEQAIRLLTSGRAGLPAYHFAGRYHTMALPIGRGRRYVGAQDSPRGANDVQVRPARPDDLPDVLAFLQAVGPGRQLFPRYQAGDFFNPSGALRDLAAYDLLLAFRAGKLVGTLGAWDQAGFKQTIVAGYGSYLRWLRGLYNCWAGLRGRPRLPQPGQALRYLTAALPVVAGDDAVVFKALVDALLCRTPAAEYLLIGLAEGDPLLAVLRSYRGVCYTTNVYLVCWQDGDELRASFDGRPLYLELGSL
jgi:hypothetical protein